MVKIKAELEIPESRVADLLCAAMEGGIGSWARIVGYRQPPGDVWKAEGWDKEIYKHIHWPMSDGGAMFLFDAEEEWEQDSVQRLGMALDKVEGVWVVDHLALERGLGLMARHPQYRHHFANFMAENEDAETGDVFLQFSVLGEVVYG